MLIVKEQELKILIDVLAFSTDVYEDLHLTIKESPSRHLTYLKEKALLAKYKKDLLKLK